MAKMMRLFNIWSRKTKRKRQNQNIGSKDGEITNFANECEKGKRNWKKRLSADNGPLAYQEEDKWWYCPSAGIQIMRRPNSRIVKPLIDLCLKR